ncbi:MAG: SRPBCC domain-containing protein [Burkholderiaceae bacterium]
MKALATLLIFVSLACAAATERGIDKTVVVPATLDQTWEAWTTRSGIISFFAPDAKIEPKAGGAFQIYINPLAEAGLKGADDMQFMALQPKQMMSFTWNAPPSLPTVRQQRTFVVLRFEPVSDKETRVSLHHTGWGDGDEWDKAFAYFDRAWGNVLANLKKRFETGPIDWTDWMNNLRKMQEQAAQKK